MMDPFNVAELGPVFQEVGALMERMEGIVYAVPICNMTMSLSEVASTIIDVTKSEFGPKNVRVRPVLVGRGEIAELLAQGTGQRAKVPIPMYETVDEALAYIRVQIASGM